MNQQKIPGGQLDAGKFLQVLQILRKQGIHSSSKSDLFLFENPQDAREFSELQESGAFDHLEPPEETINKQARAGQQEILQQLEI